APPRSTSGASAPRRRSGTRRRGPREESPSLLMRVLIVGGTGFIGSHVVAMLAAQGHALAVFHRAQGSPAAGVQEIAGDRDKSDELGAAIHRFQPDVVLDLILYTEPQARALVDLARGATGRLVVLSSADVYRNYDGLRGRSAAPPDPTPLDEEA